MAWLEAALPLASRRSGVPRLAITILDRYMVAELIGPFIFGLSAFALIFAATDILAIGRLVADQHAPLAAALGYFLWQLPQIALTVVPMAMLLAVLLALQRLSGESEITAMKAGGIGVRRIVLPLLIVGLGVSLLSLIVQETIVAYANDRAIALRDETISRVGAFGGTNHAVMTPLPNGGQQMTYFRGYDAATRTLLYTTIIAYGTDKRPLFIIVSDRGQYDRSTWTFTDATEYRFNPDGTTLILQHPVMEISIGERPSQIEGRTKDGNPEDMSLYQIREIIDSGQLSAQQKRAYQTTFEEKIARPFGSFVLTLLAAPFGLRPTRGGGTGRGFSLAVAIVFVYFVIASVCSAVARSLPGGYFVSALAAWTPNVLFTAIGAVLLRRAARY
ncbi:MAG TPA: LptF/LptG family permease [Candidatus Baltobacteraceae bacterium]|nr:LptF/LptG family permease [Candidatus Baltobacteraceae bacterium]